MTKKIFSLLFLIQFSVSYCQQLTVSENTKISVITVGLADEVHSLYGHTALRIQDSKLNFDLVYNYGMFDFRTENFVAKFAKGDLQYYAAAYPYADFEYSYREDNRSIYEQVLNLSVTEKQTLFDKLNTSLLPENTFYTYKFIDRNCTTKVIDIVNEVLENKPIVKKNSDATTYREVLNPYTENHFYEQLGINVIFGQKTDRQATTLFLPLDLYHNLKNCRYKNKSLVSETNIIFEANRTSPKSYLDSIYSLIAILFLFVIANKKVTNCIYFSVLGEVLKKNISDKIDLAKASKFISVDHPYLFYDVISQHQEEGRINVATVGLLNEVKGLNSLVEYATKINSKLRERLRISVIGKIDGDQQLLKQSKIKFATESGVLLGRDEFNCLIQKQDYLLYFYPCDSYRLVASGAIFDAICYEKPILALKNDYFEYIFKKYGEFGFLFKDISIMIQRTEDILDSDFVGADFKSIKAKLTPESISQQFFSEMCSIGFIKK